MRRLSSSALFFKILMGIKTYERSFYMQNNIIDLLGFKDRDITANITKSSPSSIEVTVSKVCKAMYCPVCNHRMYSRGPYTRTLNHPILQDGRKIIIKLRQRFLFSQRKSAAIRAIPKDLEEVTFKTNIIRGLYVKKAYHSVDMT